MLMYLVLGCLMDAMAMIILTVPIVFPVVTALGFDPIWFGIIIVMTVELGLIHPPVGMNVFVIKTAVKDISFATIFKGVLPFIADRYAAARHPDHISVDCALSAKPDVRSFAVNPRKDDSTMARKRPEDLRSHRWYGVNDLRAFGHRSRMAQMGYDRADYAGKPVIGIINTWSDINACHTHFSSGSRR